MVADLWRLGGIDKFDSLQDARGKRGEDWVVVENPGGSMGVAVGGDVQRVVAFAARAVVLISHDRAIGFNGD